MKTDSHSHSVSALPPDLRLIALRRRVSASGPLAMLLADLCYGTPRRDDVTAIHLASVARVASDSPGAHS